MVSRNEYLNDSCQSSDDKKAQWLLVCDPTTKGDILEKLTADDTSVALLERIAEHPNTPNNILRQLAAHSHPQVRSAVTDNPNVSEEIMLMLSGDEHPDVRFYIAENHNTPPRVLQLLLNDHNPHVTERAKRTLQRLDLPAQGPIDACVDRKIESEQLAKIGLARRENRKYSAKTGCGKGDLIF